MSFTCRFCGETWERHPATVVDCPTCKAKAGSPCRRPSEHAGGWIEPHAAREQLAVDTGLLSVCPAAPARQERLF